jgi:hypothetical protein
MVLRERVHTRKSASLVLLLALCAFALLTSAPASAAGIVANDGKIHACYKAKGKGKGTVRLVRSAKVKCPKKWKKASWYASGQAGPQGDSGAPGNPGETGTNGGSGLPGTTGTVTVKALQDKVTELLTKVQSLETILRGIDNTQLKEAIAAVANVKALESTVATLCTQSSTLTNQANALESALGGLSLNTALTTLGGVLNVPALPGPLSSFSCPG